MTMSEKGYKLYDFQKEVSSRFIDTSGVLDADDMGLGKTLEALDLDYQRRRQGTPDFLDVYRERSIPTLILAPMSVVTSWEETIAWALPQARVVSLDSKNRPAFITAIQDGKADYFIMHWDALRLMPELANTKWFHVIGDEIHRVKNRKAQVTRALKKLKTGYKTGLSGTPADNKPHDLWSILNWLYPQSYRSYWKFYKTFVDYTTVTTSSGHEVPKILGVKNVKLLHKEMAHYYIRRRKEEVLKDLPDKYYNTLWVDLSPTQRRMYNAMKKDMIAWVGSQDQEKPLPAPSVITQLLRLQQFACASIDIETQTVRQRNKHYDEDRVVEWRKKNGILIPQNADWYDPWITVTKPKYVMLDPSSKLDAAMAMLEDSDEPIVFFSHFRTMVDLFAKRLAGAGISYGTIMGGMSKDSRGDVVRNFQQGRTRVVAGTIAAGGVGITLTRASHVAFFDRAWSPSVNRQAEDRLHRIGQKNAVQVTDIMAKNTIDLGRVQQIQEKWTWIQKLLGDKTMDYQKGAQQDELLLEAVRGIL